MKWLIVGGSGRSGTSFISRSLLNHPEVTGFLDIELKILSNSDGLYDLYNSIVKSYSPDQANISLERFINLLNKVALRGYFSPFGLEEDYNVPICQILDSFKMSITKNGQTIHQSKDEFLFKSRSLLNQIAEVSQSSTTTDKRPQYFLENTPHNLLKIHFISELLPDSSYLHIMRDPRSVAMSLSKMEWGPGSLITCAEWVNQYLIEWKNVSDYWSKESTVNLIETYIEDIAKEKTQSSIEICHALGITVDENLFKPELSILNDWSLAVDKKDFELLNNILENWIDYYGYFLEKVGVRS